MNMLYPKNVVTYSAYVKNMEGFVKSTLGLKKEVKFVHRQRALLESGEEKQKITIKDSKRSKLAVTISQSGETILR